MRTGRRCFGKYSCLSRYFPREEIPEIPYEALKEALLNAIIHRDYFEIGARVMVEIFDDRVEISNPGELLFEKEKMQLYLYE